MMIEIKFGDILFEANYYKDVKFFVKDNNLTISIGDEDIYQDKLTLFIIKILNLATKQTHQYNLRDIIKNEIFNNSSMEYRRKVSYSIYEFFEAKLNIDLCEIEAAGLERLATQSGGKKNKTYSYYNWF